MKKSFLVLFLIPLISSCTVRSSEAEETGEICTLNFYINLDPMENLSNTPKIQGTRFIASKRVSLGSVITIPFYDTKLEYNQGSRKIVYEADRWLGGCKIENYAMGEDYIVTGSSNFIAILKVSE